MSLIWLLEQDELLVDYRAGYEQSASDCSAKAQGKVSPNLQGDGPCIVSATQTAYYS